MNKYNIPKNGCLHVGANLGSELEMYDEFGFLKVVWIEGYKPFYDELRKKIEGKENHFSFNLMECC